MRLKPYRDTAGKLTIGVGRNLDDVGVSDAEADVLLANDVARVMAGLDRDAPWWREMTEPRQRALANMAFNLGPSGLSRFVALLAALQAGRYAAAADEATNSLWARQVGARATRIAGLLRAG